MNYCQAKGEAEAELARLNRLGIIDAVMTDDVDALIFGARDCYKEVSPLLSLHLGVYDTSSRSQSLNLSGNKSYPAINREGKQSHHHVNIYAADAIKKETGLTTGGMILFALLAGGDYDDVRLYNPTFLIHFLKPMQGV